MTERSEGLTKEVKKMKSKSADRREADNSSGAIALGEVSRAVKSLAGRKERPVSRLNV